jgi:hypothetical protein
MRGLVWGVFALLTVMTTAAFGARALGHAQPDPALLDAFHFTDCPLPCWAGITVGQTARDEALERLTDHFASRIAYVLPVGDSEMVVHVASDQGSLDILLHSSRNVITAVILDTKSIDGLLFEDLVAWTGIPSCAADIRAVYQTSDAYAVVQGIRGKYGRGIAALHSIRLYRLIDVAGYLPSACR